MGHIVPVGESAFTAAYLSWVMLDSGTVNNHTSDQFSINSHMSGSVAAAIGRSGSDVEENSGAESAAHFGSDALTEVAR